MKLLYLSLSYVPSRRASSVHVMRMCSALARAGHDVELVAKPALDTPSTCDDHAFYGVAPEFRVTKLPRPRRRGGGVIFAASVARTLLARRASGIDLVYSRELMGALIAAELRIPFLFESHGVPTERLNRVIARRIARHSLLRGLIAISDALRRDLITEEMAPKNRPIIVAHDAADAPSALELAAGNRRPRIGYVGNLYAGRGIEMIFEIARRIPEYEVELVGGTEGDLARWRARGVPANVKLAGFVQPAMLRDHYRSFDVLLMPTARTGVAGASGGDISRWTSPMKMFEYMASGAPIVASDLPVLGEVLRHERNAIIAPADDAAAWEQAVRRLCADRALARTLAAQAYDDLVREYTWDARVRKIFLNVN